MRSNVFGDGLILRPFAPDTCWSIKGVGHLNVCLQNLPICPNFEKRGSNLFTESVSSLVRIGLNHARHVPSRVLRCRPRCPGPAARMPLPVAAWQL